MKATAVAYANIALVKYWGKRDAALNLPARGSLSLTLTELRTVTTVAWGQAADAIWLDGAVAKPNDAQAITTFLERVRERRASLGGAHVVTRNEFPTAAGLASSASGYAALAAAATAAAGVSLTPSELSVLARHGSGSAARSIFGGLVIMHAGVREDGADAFAEPMAAALTDSLAMIVAIVGDGAPKAFSSRDSMQHCAATSPLYGAWLETVSRDLVVARAAIEAGDIATLGAIVEGNAMAMHATAIASRPSVVFWRPESIAALARVRELRAANMPAWATMDAGPHVKVLTTRVAADAVATAMREVPGVVSVLITHAAPGVCVTETSP